MLTRILDSQPNVLTHRSSRGMQNAGGLSTSTVQRIWRAFELQLHQADTFNLSTDPLFVENVRDIIGFQMAPLSHAVVLYGDEKN